MTSEARPTAPQPYSRVQALEVELEQFEAAAVRSPLGSQRHAAYIFTAPRRAAPAGVRMQSC